MGHSPQGNATDRGVLAPLELQAQAKVRVIPLGQQVALVGVIAWLVAPDNQFSVLHFPGLTRATVHDPIRQVLAIEQRQEAVRYRYGGGWRLERLFRRHCWGWGRFDLGQRPRSGRWVRLHWGWRWWGRRRWHDNSHFLHELDFDAIGLARRETDLSC